MIIIKYLKTYKKILSFENSTKPVNVRVFCFNSHFYKKNANFNYRSEPKTKNNLNLCLTLMKSSETGNLVSNFDVTFFVANKSLMLKAFKFLAQQKQ